MTRFKEQRRMDRAVADRNFDELVWAKEYSQRRLQLSILKEHKKRWEKQLKEIERAISDL